MAKLHEKVFSLHFRRLAKVWVILVLAVALIGGGASAALLASQINEAITYARTADEQERTQSQLEATQPTEEEHDRESRREHRDWESIPFSEPSTAAKAAVGVTAVLALALGVAYWLLCAAWLSRAAFTAKMNGKLWFVLALLGNLAAILLFWVVRAVLRTKCPQCGTWQHRGHYCAGCGAELLHYCPSCGGSISAKDLFCQHCGVSLKQTHAEAQQ